MVQAHRSALKAPPSTRDDFRRGFVDILPIVAAAFPIGVLWGTLAVKKGLSPFEAGLISASAFGGAAQFVAVDWWRNQAPWLPGTVSGFVVAFRHGPRGAARA